MSFSSSKFIVKTSHESVKTSHETDKQYIFFLFKTTWLDNCYLQHLDYYFRTERSAPQCDPTIISTLDITEKNGRNGAMPGKPTSTTNNLAFESKESKLRH